MAFFSLLAIAVGILSAMGLVVVGLVEAPWPILLTGLLAALYGLQRIVQGTGEGQMLRMPLRSQPASPVVATTDPAATQAPVAPEPDPKSGPEPEPPAAATAETYELIYRGIRYRVPKASPIPEPKPADAGSTESAEPDQPKPPVVEGIYRRQRWRR
ncbi:MAG: hypothetical protein EA368_06265 [Leptolyngbya sp. DLM2.Bin27]|nr:MAG: hypothetical protein EA368_06265 [Leptolyngbya sp. DLM2.Bin27]